MLERNQPSVIQETWNSEGKTAVPLPQYPRRRISVAIEIPFQRADLPAISLILLALTLIGWGVWTDNSLRFLFGAAPVVIPGVPLLPSLLQQNGVPLTFALALALLILAGALALAPLHWWAYIRLVRKTGFGAQRRPRRHRTQDPDDAEAWVAAQAAWIEEYEAAAKQAKATPARAERSAAVADSQLPNQPTEETVAAATPTSTAATAQQPSPEPTAAEQSAPEQPATEQVASEQGTPAPSKDGQTNPPQTPQGAQPAQGQSPAASQETTEEAKAPAQPKPGVMPPQQPSADLAALLEESKEAALDLDDLTDVEDILSSFADNDTISPQLLGLSASVNEVDLEALVAHVHEVACRFDQEQMITDEAPPKGSPL